MKGFLKEFIPYCQRVGHELKDMFTPEVEFNNERDRGLRIIVTGYARHGKDTVCEWLRDKYHFKFESSSVAASKEFIYDKLKDKYGYTCIEDSIDHVHSSNEIRKLWFDLISEYNKDDYARLAKLIFKENDIYAGTRNVNELNEIRRQGVVDIVIWVDASKRVKAEPSTSITITPQDCDFVINNNTSLKDLYRRIDYLFFGLGMSRFKQMS